MPVPDFSPGEVLTAAAMDSIGLWLVKTQTIGTGVSSVTVTGAFSSSYENYLIQIAGGVGSTDLDLRFNFDGNTANYYTGAIGHPYATASGNAFGLGRNNLAYWDFAGNANNNNIYMNVTILSPFLAKKSGFISTDVVGNTAGSTVYASGFHDSATSFTGFRLQTSTGTLTGGTDTGTDIEADLLSSAPMYGPANEQLYGASASAFYEGNYYDSLVYVARYTPDTAYLGDGLLKLELTVTGDYAVDYRISTSPAFYGTSGDPFYGTAGEDFYEASQVGEWTPWPGVLGPFDTTADTYDVRLSVAAGATQGVCSQFDLITDLPDVVEVLDDVVISAGSTRLPITKTYRAIKVVNVTVQTDGNGGISARIIDKDETLGPDIEVLNAAGTAVNGLVDAYIQGY